MGNIPRNRVLRSDSGNNRKSKTSTAFDKLRPRACRGELSRSIRNLKWVGLSVIAFVLAVTGAVVQAQQPTQVPRIGVLVAATPSTLADRVEAFRQGLRELGYVEGKNIIIDFDTQREN